MNSELRILAFDSSIQTTCVALLEDGRRICGSKQSTGASSAVRRRGDASQHLIPQIQELCAKASWSIRDVQLIAFTRGPGSFTGIRIGIVTAKTLAYSLGAEIVGVDTLEVLARQSARWLETSSSQRIRCVINAQRQQLFACDFQVSPDTRCVQPIAPTEIVNRSTWIESLRAGDVVNGPGLKSTASEIRQSGVQIVPESWWQPQAEEIGRMAWECFNRGRLDDVWSVQPLYFRPSYAEETPDRSPSVENRANSK